MDDSRITSFQRAERLLAVGDRTLGGRLLAPLVPLSHLYGLAMRARAALYARGLLRQQILPCRVISVGNLTVGGTGKTPVVIALAAALRDRGRIWRAWAWRRAPDSPPGACVRGGGSASRFQPWIAPRRCSSRAPRRPSGWTSSRPRSARCRRRCRSGSPISR